MEFGNDEVIGVRRNGVDGKEGFIECAPFTTGAIVTSGTKQGGLAKSKWTCDVVATANVGGLPSQGEIHAGVRTRAAGLMDFHRDGVSARDESRDWNSGVLPSAFI